MKKLTTLVFILTSLILASLATACKNPVVYNEYGVPVSIFGGGILSISYEGYPAGDNVVDYVLSIKNTNSQGLNVTFTPSSSLMNYVYGNTVVLNPDEQKQFSLRVNIGGSSQDGGLLVDGTCEDGNSMAQGVIVIYITGRGSPAQNCYNSKTSCGLPGDCKDLRNLDGCYNGILRTYYCSANTPKYSEDCTDYCCGLVGGTCNGGTCNVPRFSVNLPVNITNGTGKPISAMIKLYEPGTSNVANTSTINGYGVISSPNATVDFNLEYDSILNILIRNLGLTGLTGTLNIILDKVSTTIPNTTMIKAYKVSTSLSSFSGVLKFKYSGLTVGNEQNLAMYKCSSYNSTSNTCNGAWVIQSTVKDTANDVVSTEITSFSVYVLGESQITTTTTSTTTTISGSSNNDDNSDSGSSYSSGSSGRYTTTTIRATTTLVECTCGSWSNSGCGENPCDQTQMKQQRTCNPSGCNIESQCIVDDSCNVQQTNENETQMTSQSTGLFVLPNLSQYVYPISGIIILAGAGIAAWKLNGRIRGFLPSYKFSSRSSKKGHVTVNVESPKYMEIKMVEKPKVEVTKPVEQPRMNIEARNRSIEEMRNRALEIDKKMKRK